MVELRAVGVRTAAGDLVFDFYCGGQHFPAAVPEPGDPLAAVAECIRGFRAGGQRYPAYLTDLELPQESEGESGPRDPQTCQYVWHRQRLQAELNQALERL